MLFEVVRTPDGSSPAWVREAWIGVQFPALQGAPVSIPTRSADGGRDAEVTERHGYSVGARDVLGLLALRKPEAAQWYIDNVPQMLDRDQVFLFDAACCKAITAEALRE